LVDKKKLDLRMGKIHPVNAKKRKTRSTPH